MRRAFLVEMIAEETEVCEAPPGLQSELTQSKLKGNVKERQSATILTMTNSVGTAIHSLSHPESNLYAWIESSRSQSSPPMQLESLTVGHSGGTQFMALGNLTEVGQDQTMPESKLGQP